MISEQLHGQTSHQELKASNRHGTLMEDDDGDDTDNVSLTCLSLYTRGGGCRVGTAKKRRQEKLKIIVPDILQLNKTSSKSSRLQTIVPDILQSKTPLMAHTDSGTKLAEIPKPSYISLKRPNRIESESSSYCIPSEMYEDVKTEVTELVKGEFLPITDVKRAHDIFAKSVWASKVFLEEKDPMMKAELITDLRRPNNKSGAGECECNCHFAKTN